MDGLKRVLVNLMAAVGVVLAGLACLRLDTFLPFALPAVPEFLGWIFLLGGLGLITLAEASFLARGGSTGAPADPTRRLVVTGIYRWVRNPIYLGGALVLMGAALFRRSPTLFLAACLYIPIMDGTIVRNEEKRLERDFGGDYLEYKRKVPRWIPKPPH